MGTDAVGVLGASGSDSQSVELVAPSAPGPYYYGACVDTVADESDTTNNCSVALTVDVLASPLQLTGEPDLVVASPSVNDSNPAAGASFTLSATVRNDGDGGSLATTLRYYRSTDATITTSDTEEGTDAITELGALGSSSQSVNLAAPSSPGTYYYGACVDTVTDKSDTTNNCSASVKVDVEAPKYPDLEVGTPTVSDTSPETGSSFTLSATVSNTGDGESVATTLRYYRSTDATITTSDTAVGTDAVGALGASGTSAESISLNAPTTAGAYYYGACVDAVKDESDTTDNCSTSMKLDVEAPKYPDLEVGTPTVSDSTPETGASFTLSATVSNTGDGESVATTLRYYRSTDATITTSDTAVGTDAVSGLTSSGSGAESISLTAPSTAGTYYYGACVDAVTDESDTTDNCSTSVKLDVEAPKYPDLEVGTPTVSDSTPETGASFILSATVSNTGDGESVATTLRYYRSTDATITTSDTAVGTDAVGALGASGTSAKSISLTAPLTAGTYYYGACVDAVTDESDTTNNCSSSVTIAVEEPSSGQPDLRIVGLITLTPLDGVSPGTRISFSANVRNYGDANSDATTLRYYLSTDATISVSDTEVGTDEVSALVPSEQVVEGIDLTALSTGTYYYGACVDTVTGESDTTNNCSGAAEITVAGPQTSPDLSVGSPTVNNNSPEMGGAFTLSATVSNDGDGAAAATTLRYYRSTDATISVSDTEVGTDEVSALVPSEQVVEGIDLTALSTGTYYYGACVDAVAGESDTTNNCSSSVAVTVAGAQTSPDLSVGSPTVNNNSPEMGGAFTLSATVSNDGDGAAAATTLRYYRSMDATITTSDTAVGTDAVSGLASSGSSAESISLTAPSTAGTYYYGACVDTVAGESDSTNNCSTAVQVIVRVPERSDLMVVSSSVSNNSPTVGSQFTLSATVSNAGGGESAATTLRYYRSTDATITTSDTAVGTDAVGVLGASGSDSQSVELVAPSAPGPYYYGACVDTVSGESDTANNCSTAVQVTVRVPERSDLMVVSSSVSNNSPTVGSQFTLSATVSNAGGGESAATTLRYYRSTDATITTSDAAVGTDAVGVLGASGSDSQSVELVAPSAPGPYYYGACVDTVADESDTTNNCSVALTVDVLASPLQLTGEPDLVVASPSVNDSNPAAGASFTLSVTVRNDGDGGSLATTLRYYRSTDATITTSDTEEGTDAITELGALGSSSQSVNLAAPSSPGTYYYGACVDTVTDKSDTTNNCSASVKVDVEAPKYPDLEVGTPTVSDTSPETGSSFTLSATVSNTGDGESVATTLRYYRSTDATITTSDTAVGTDAVGALGASGTSAESISLNAPTTAGAYYYGACVDAVKDESDTTDNCSTSMKLDVEAPKYPDLEVGTPTVSDSTPETGASFTLSATVSNTGDGESVATTLRYYRSTDATITTSDTAVGTDAVSGLTSSGSGAESISLTAPSTAGTYYYGACVDAVTDESDTTDNCSTSVKLDVEAPKYPDLEVGTPTVSDSTPETGASFILSATVSNTGDGESVATTLRYYRSTDATITTSDTAVGTDAVGALGASGTSAKSISLTAPLTAGTYYYGACVDAVTDESDTTNNCSSSVTIAVEEPSSGQPDLRIVGLITLTPLDGVSPGTRISFSANVRNYGDANSDATTLRYYLSTDATISVSDTEVGTDEVSALVPSEQVVEGIDLTALSTGTYYYGACVDTVTGESDTTNNCSGAAEITVAGPQTSPDLSVGSPTVNNNSPEMGGAFTLSATVSNDGDGAAAATTLRYYRSTDATISVSDTEVGTDEVSALVPSEQVVEGIDLTALSTGTYYYGACVDAVAGESDTTNNCSSSVAVTVAGAQTSPDLSVGSPTVNNNSPEMGGAFTLSATVSNDGDGAAAATTLRYYRSMDATITTSDTAVGTDAVSGLASSGSSAESISLTAPSTAGTYYYGACVDAVTDESDTTNNCSASVTVTVTELASQPDLIVDYFNIFILNPTLETSPGALVQLYQRVANVGDAASAVTTVRYYRSTDATITPSDTQVSTDAVPILAASIRFVETQNERLPTTPGTYYYGACVDAVVGESNTANNCSRSVKVTVPEPQPDLVVGSSVSVEDSNLNTGASFTLSATVRNAGDEQSAASTLRYYRSTDSTISSSDTQVGTDAVGALAASGTSDESISLTAPATAGAYYYGACVDAVTDESDTTNNCSSSVTIAVEEPSSGQPDLRIVGIITLTPLDGVSPGIRITFSVNVRNDGDANSDATTLRYYRSTDPTISVSDTEVGTDEVSALVPSERVVEGIDLTAPSIGTYYYGACVDAVPGESDTTNNCSGAAEIVVN